MIAISRMLIDGMGAESARPGGGGDRFPAPSPYRAAAARPAGVASHLVNFAETGLGAEAGTG